MKKLLGFIVLAAAVYFALLKLGLIGEINTTSMTKPSAKEEQPEQKSTESGKKKSAAESVIDYGTGYTQLKVKQRSSDKINDIYGKHNKALEENMED